MRHLVQRHHVTRRGLGRPMVFVHGFGGNQQTWRHVAPAFESTHTTVLYDLAGCGRSDRAAYDSVRHARLEGHAADLVELLDGLELREVTVVAHSVGAMIAVLAAVERPGRIGQLVLLGPSPRYIDEPGYAGGFSKSQLLSLLQQIEVGSDTWQRFLAQAVMKNPERPELSAELQAAFAATDPVRARQFAEATFLSDHRDVLACCHTPALVVQCQDDAIAPKSVGRFVHRHLSGADYVELSATGHMPQWSHPAETIAAIRDWTERRREALHASRGQ